MDGLGEGRVIPECLLAQREGGGHVAGAQGCRGLRRGRADVGTVAAWVASDQARTMTAADVNIFCGAIMD